MDKTLTVKNLETIIDVGFKSTADQPLVTEAMSVESLRQRATSDHFQKLQRADFYRLIGVDSGQTSLMVDFSTYQAQAGAWLLVRPGQVMRYDFSTEWTGWLVVFRPEGLFTQGRNYQTEEVRLWQKVDDLASMHRLKAQQHEWMTQSVRQMMQDGEMKSDASLRNELLRLQLTSTLLRLSVWEDLQVKPAHPSKSMTRDFKRFQQRIETDFAKYHQVQHYANALGMSEKSLSRLCLAAAGVSAKHWIAQRLCLEAKRLLAHTSMSVQRIGNDLGYDDASNFVKFFRRQEGLTPLSFRRVNSQADKRDESL